ncbi:MAG: hypothetical protein AAGA85_00835 [Bacteroidota bacterium]
MDEALTISRVPSELKSMQYQFLRDEGIQHIQRLAGKIWTDYNVHDPGISIFEVLCYAITDLGYRSGFDMQDLLADHPEAAEKLKQFYTAREILHNDPVTIRDYRKLLMDVAIPETDGPDSPLIGIKNAWIESVSRGELDVYVDREASRLTYEPVSETDEPLALKILYNVLLEFEDSEVFGDLNDNELERVYTLANDDVDNPKLQDIEVRVELRFPRWDEGGVDWNELSNIKQSITEVSIDFLNLTDEYDISYRLKEDKDIVLSGDKGKFDEDIPDLEAFNDRLNDAVFALEGNMLRDYQTKVFKVLSLVEKARKRLHANRNLGEDFLQFSALKVEEILVCADIELENDANVEEVQAQLYYQINQYISPTIGFYSLEEIIDKCIATQKYALVRFDAPEKRLTVKKELGNQLQPASVVTYVNPALELNQNLTVSSVAVNPIDGELRDVFVKESIPEVRLGEEVYLINGTSVDEDCNPVEKIFEGPALEHGFLDDGELDRVDRKKVLYASDLIQLLMDIPGVVAVKNLELASIPAEDPVLNLEPKSVRWCLELAFDQNYVPRFNGDSSRITFFKDQLPFQANSEKVKELLSELEDAEPPRRPRFPTLDFKVPQGKYRELEDYVSIQEEFPQTYGIGEEGLPTIGDRDQHTYRTALARQLKGFLTHFDQLLANYLSQLAHVRDLLAIEGDVNQTYFTQSLLDTIPDADPLYFDIPNHDADLRAIIEDIEVFEDRRNRFLDHLISRFAEQFTDYALMTNDLAGPKAPSQLIVDKQDFIQEYPRISTERGTAFDYTANCELWHVDNVSGFEKRAELLSGIKDKPWTYLAFGESIEISESGGVFSFNLKNASNQVLMTGNSTYSSEEELYLALEKLVVAGACEESYTLEEDEDCNYRFLINCGGEVLAVSEETAYDTEVSAQAVIDEVSALLAEEFLTNAKSNRYNLTLPFDNFFEVEINTDMGADPPTYSIHYRLFETPNDFSDPSRVLLAGNRTASGEAKQRVAILAVDLMNNTFTVEGDLTDAIKEGDQVLIVGSRTNDDSYEVHTVNLNLAGDTVIEVDNIPGASAPLGELRYNIVDEAELTAFAATEVRDFLWDVAWLGSRSGNYNCGGSLCTGEETTFDIVDIRGEVLGQGSGNASAVEVQDFLQKEFVTHEGIHLVEHILLRPKVKDPFVPLSDTTLSETLANNGAMSFQKVVEIAAVLFTARIFEVAGDVTSEVVAMARIATRTSSGVERNYRVLNRRFVLATNRTQILVREAIDPQTPLVGTTLSYGRTVAIDSVDADARSITVADSINPAHLIPGGVITISRSTAARNNGNYTLEGVDLSEGNLTITLKEVQKQLEDTLLPIYLETDPDVLADEACDACKMDNPYSCILQVVLPAWPGRFDEDVFRKFMERTLRVEAPAHLFLNICWISYDQMEEFERVYKQWILTNAKRNPNKEVLSQRLTALIEVLDRLRNVHPTKTLHDCDDDRGTEDAIILDNTALGEI